METQPTSNGTKEDFPVEPQSLSLDDYSAEVNALLRAIAVLRSVVGQLENFALCLSAKCIRPNPPTSPSGALHSPDAILRPSVDVTEILKQAEQRTVRHSRGKPVPADKKQGEETHELSATAN